MFQVISHCCEIGTCMDVGAIANMRGRCVIHACSLSHRARVTQATIDIAQVVEMDLSALGDRSIKKVLPFNVDERSNVKTRSVALAKIRV